ncbi:hypothetical protein [Caudoviricetes sp.]|nr:hypothetical protein [Caudoviricetes sp.]UOF81007.1 hypothetical protein [Caudoviricetes sp.]UOF81403.1 hypothetical protein [Caudoviricetes sp.]
MKPNLKKLRVLRPHRQIIHFVSGVKRTIENVIYISENEMTHLYLADGSEWIINKNNVLAIHKIFS